MAIRARLLEFQEHLLGEFDSGFTGVLQLHLEFALQTAEVLGPALEGSDGAPGGDGHKCPGEKSGVATACPPESAGQHCDGVEVPEPLDGVGPFRGVDQARQSCHKRSESQ